MYQAVTHIEKVAGGADKMPEIWYVLISNCFKVSLAITATDFHSGTVRPVGPLP